MFRLFSENPELKSLFSFASNINTGNINREDAALQTQAKKLMSMIDYAIRCLGNLEELVPKLKRLGKRHFVKYNVKPEHFEVCYHWMVQPLPPHKCIMKTAVHTPKTRKLHQIC